MKKKVICGLLGLTVLCSGLYWFFKDKETEKIPDLDEDDEEDFADKEIEKDFDDNDVNFEKNVDKVFEEKNENVVNNDNDNEYIDDEPITLSEDEPTLEETENDTNVETNKETDNEPEYNVEPSDYDDSNFKLVCDVDRETAIQFILSATGSLYTEEELKGMLNSKLAELYLSYN